MARDAIEVQCDHCRNLLNIPQHTVRISVSSVCALLHSILFGSKCTAIQFCVFKWPTIIPKCICEWCPLSSGCMWCLELWGIWSVCDFHKTLDTHSCEISPAVWNSVFERGFQPRHEDSAQCFLDVSSPSHPVSEFSMCVRSSYHLLKPSCYISFCPDSYLLATFSAVLATIVSWLVCFYIFLHLRFCNVWGNDIRARGHLLCQHIWLSIPAISGTATFRVQSPAHLQNIPMFELAWVATEC